MISKLPPAIIAGVKHGVAWAIKVALIFGAIMVLKHFHIPIPEELLVLGATISGGLIKSPGQGKA